MKYIKARYLGCGEYEVRFWPFIIKFGHAVLDGEVKGGFWVYLFKKRIAKFRLEELRD